MPLIIESYDVPHTKIANILFKNKVFKHISEPCIEPEEQDVYAYTRKDEDDYRAISYYFKKILYFENGRIVCTDKIAHKIVLYDPETGKPIVFSRNQPSEQIDKTDFLPQINAQNGDIVIFPDQEDEDED